MMADGMTGIFGDEPDETTEYGGAPGTNSLPERTTGAADRPPRYPAPNSDHTPDDPGARVA
jgi:hypothetical protein